MSEADVVAAPRIEVFTVAGRRRNWTEEEGAAIVAESFEEGLPVSLAEDRRRRDPSLGGAVLSSQAYLKGWTGGVFW